MKIFGKEIKFKPGEIETGELRIFYLLFPISKEESTGKIWFEKPRFKLYKFPEEKLKSGNWFYKYSIEFFWICIEVKNHPAYEIAARKYNWNAVIEEKYLREEK